MEAKRVISKIRNTVIFDCKHMIDSNGIGHILHNQTTYDSYHYQDKHGYTCQYSYNPEYTRHDEIKIIEGDFKEVKIHKDLVKFEEVEDLNLIYLFVINKGKFKDYNEMSLTKEGLISLNNSVSNKKLEIKIGRFVRSLLDDNKDFIIQNNLFDFDRIDTNVLEKITNEYKKYANNGSLKLEILKGEDILKGYTRENYLIQRNHSGLSRSCMTDKLDFLELYTKNSNVELAVLYLLDKVVARCLVWTTTDNEKVYDEIYSNFEWASNSLEEELEKIKIRSLYDNYSTMFIKLEFDPVHYPYLDTFFYFDTYSKRLCNESYGLDWDKKLRDAEGHWEYRDDEEEDD
jgi:hypothetical protein